MRLRPRESQARQLPLPLGPLLPAWDRQTPTSASANATPSSSIILKLLITTLFWYYTRVCRWDWPRPTGVAEQLWVTPGQPSALTEVTYEKRSGGAGGGGKALSGTPFGTDSEECENRPYWLTQRAALGPSPGEVTRSACRQTASPRVGCSTTHRQCGQPSLGSGTRSLGLSPPSCSPAV